MAPCTVLIVSDSAWWAVGFNWTKIGTSVGDHHWTAKKEQFKEILPGIKDVGFPSPFDQDRKVTDIWILSKRNEPYSQYLRFLLNL